MHNRQRQALISAYSAVNITVVGSGTVDGNGWDWWRNITNNMSNDLCKEHCPGSGCPAACLIQRPKLNLNAGAESSAGWRRSLLSC